MWVSLTDLCTYMLCHHHGHVDMAYLEVEYKSSISVKTLSLVNTHTHINSSDNALGDSLHLALLLF